MLADTGAYFISDAAERTKSDIIQIVESIRLNSSHITITKTKTELIQIAMVYPKRISFDLIQGK